MILIGEPRANRKSKFKAFITINNNRERSLEKFEALGSLKLLSL